MEPYQVYNPSVIQQNTNGLYSNQFRFRIDRLPDLSFFVQGMRTPSVSSGQVLQTNPFSTIHHAGDHLSYSTFEVTYLIDARFKNYFSLYYWMKGYGFPHSFEEVIAFRENEMQKIGNFRARPAEIERTTGLLQIITPDTGSLVAEFHLDDIFPTELSPLSFETTTADAPLLITTATFSCSNFEVKTYA